MNEILYKEANDLLSQVHSFTSYVHGYLILNRLNVLVDIVGIDNFDHQFRHVYNSAISLINYPPGTPENDNHLSLLKRELKLTVPKVVLYLRQTSE